MTPSTALPLDQIDFDNRFVRDLPGDASGIRDSRQVTGAAFSLVEPLPTSRPRVIAIADAVATMLGVEPEVLGSADFAAVMTGNRVPIGAAPFAMNYGGHQFGHWAGQLGDGRAISIGEVITPHDGHQTLQLKGAGPTPYSRRADGLAVLRSSVREFLCSEAMFHLGVPTTRALSVATTGDRVLRDMFYDGNAEYEPGAIVCRVAPSFLRFGNFQIFAARNELDLLRELADYTIRYDFPHLGAPGPDTYLALFTETLNRTIEMIVHWMRVGFVHGVMNTDNMSVLGLTIDYGPYGWLEDYDPSWTPNTTDADQRRYRFGNQPGIAQWNLMQFANALFPLVGRPEPLQEVLDTYVPAYEAAYLDMMRAKLGFGTSDGGADRDLVRELLEILQMTETDMTVFFRSLAGVPIDTDAMEDMTVAAAPLSNAYYSQPDFDIIARTARWLRAYAARARRDSVRPAERQTRMYATNPKYVLRNYLAQLAIDDAAHGDFGMIRELATVLTRPYDDQPGKERFAEKRPEWARVRPGCSMLSCSS